MTATLLTASDSAFAIDLPKETLRIRALELDREISELSEFLYDDYGDSVDQLGIEKVRELERKLGDLEDQRSLIWEADIH
jgi:CHAD domain-containing protein